MAEQHKDDDPFTHIWDPPLPASGADLRASALRLSSAAPVVASNVEAALADMHAGAARGEALGRHQRTLAYHMQAAWPAGTDALYREASVLAWVAGHMRRDLEPDAGTKGDPRDCEALEAREILAKRLPVVLEALRMAREMMERSRRDPPRRESDFIKMMRIQREEKIRALARAKAEREFCETDLAVHGQLEDRIVDALVAGDGTSFQSAAEIAEWLQHRGHGDQSVPAINKACRRMRERTPPWPIETTEAGHRIPPSARSRLPKKWRDDDPAR
jgi:hypothetical protein